VGRRSPRLEPASAGPLQRASARTAPLPVGFPKPSPSGEGAFTGGLIDTAGVFLGATIANAYVDRRGGALRMIGWALAALVMTVTVGLGATGGGHRGMRSALGIVGALPVAAVAFVAVKDVIARWRSRG